MEAFLKRNDEWVEERRQWVEEQRDEQKRRQRASIAGLGHPEISAKSEAIVRQMGRAGRVEEDMAARVEARQAEWAQRAAEIAHEAVPAHPSITNHAASLERHGEVGSRLHQYAAVYEQRRELLRTQQLLEEMAPFEPGWAPFEPYGEGGAEETMDERAQRSAARREERLKEATPQYPFTPALNARSLAMETRREPGAPPATPSVASTSRASEPAADPECSFTPRLNPNSARIDRARRAPTGVARIDQMARRQELQRAKARRLREERESHELDGCTFRPEIRRAGGGGGEARRPKGGSISERCDAWLERREERLRREREAALARELDECTFRPAVAADDGGAAATEAVAAAETAALAPGTDEWVARQALARALRHQKAAPAYADGSRWTGALTTPKEFRLGAQRPIIRALQRPLEEADGPLQRGLRAEAAAARPSTAPALPPGFDYFGSRVELLTPERT